MASRAEPAAPARTSNAGPFRQALTDFYFDSFRLIRANLVWGAGVILAVVVGIGWPLAGVIILGLLALPTAAVFRTAADIVRADTVAGRHEVRWAFGRTAGRLLLVGVGLVVAGIVCAGNIVVGLANGGPPGWAFATLAAWGLVALWCAALVLWPVVTDPRRPDAPLRDDLSLVVQVLLTEPRRVAGLGVTAALVVVVSAVLTVALLTLSVAFVALIACRSVYPIVDRIQARSAASIGPTG